MRVMLVRFCNGAAICVAGLALLAVSPFGRSDARAAAINPPMQTITCNGNTYTNAAWQANIQATLINVLRDCIISPGGSMLANGSNAVLPTALNSLGLGTSNTPTFAGNILGSGVIHSDSGGINLGLGGFNAALNADYRFVSYWAYNRAANTSPFAIQGQIDYSPPADSATNVAGVYGDVHLNTRHAISGGPVASKGNIYAVLQMDVAVATGGSNNSVGDILTLVGGTCATQLNVAPKMTVTGVSSGSVTSVSFDGLGTCTVFPANPVTVTSNNPSATPPTLNLTPLSSPSVTQAWGVYGRVRNESGGTMAEASALLSDGCQNSSFGAITACNGLRIITPPYPGVTTSRGIKFEGTFNGGSLSSASGSTISVVLSGGAKFTTTGGDVEITGNASLLAGGNLTVAAGGYGRFAAGLSALSGTGNSSGVFAYMENSGVGHIDCLASTTASTECHLRSYNNGTYYDVGLNGSGVFGGAGSASFTSQANRFGSTGGSFSSPTNANTNILLYNGSSTNWAGIGADASGNVYLVTGTSAPATRMLWDVNGNTRLATGLLQFAGAQATFPALKRSSTTLQARLADDSGYASLQGKLTTETNYTAGTTTATGYLTLYDATGTAYKVNACTGC